MFVGTLSQGLRIDSAASWPLREYPAPKEARSQMSLRVRSDGDKIDCHTAHAGLAPALVAIDRILQNAHVPAVDCPTTSPIAEGVGPRLRLDESSLDET